MNLIKDIAFLCSVSSIFCEIVKCNPKFTAKRKSYIENLNGTFDLFTLITMDSETMKISANKTINQWTFELFQRRLEFPIFLEHKKASSELDKDEYDFFGSIKGSQNSIRLDPYKIIPDDWLNHGTIHVIIDQSTINKTSVHFFEACWIRKLNDVIKVELSSVLLLNIFRNKTQTILENLEKKKTLKMINFAIEEFEVQGIDVCNYMEFYLSECKEDSVKKFTLTFFFILMCVSMLIMLIVTVMIHKNITSTRVEPFSID